MICLNATNDSNDSAISYSSMSLSSSPVRSASIQQLLESPIIKSNSQTISQNNEKNSQSDTTSDDIIDDEIIVPESPETTAVGSEETIEQLIAELPLEVDNSQEEEIISSFSETNNTQNNCRNSLRRQTSVCVSNSSPFNASIASSPRALAILKNAIKTGLNSNKISDKTTNSNIEEVVKNEFISNNGYNSPPNNKLFRNSPLSRGSALLKAAKERLEKQEFERSPKINYNQILTESNYDRQLTGILRKHELISSPTSGEPRPKKKKVLFAEPVVSSKLEFKSSPSPTFSLNSITDMSLDLEVTELTSKQNRVLVHQNSTFDKEFDSDSQHSDSPLLFSESENNIIIPSCGQTPIRADTPTSDESSQASSVEMVCPSNTAKKMSDNSSTDVILDSNNLEVMSSQSNSEDLFMCSQAPPELNLEFNESPEEPEGKQSIGTQTIVQTIVQEDDPIVMVPMKLSQIKEIYHLFGTIIEDYSKS